MELGLFGAVDHVLDKVVETDRLVIVSSIEFEGGAGEAGALLELLEILDGEALEGRVVIFGGDNVGVGDKCAAVEAKAF